MPPTAGRRELVCRAGQITHGGGLRVEQLVGDKEAALYFKRMPAFPFGVYTVFWQPPTPSRDADKDGLNIRIKNRTLLSSILKERSIFRNESDVVPAAFRAGPNAETQKFYFLFIF